MITVLLISDKPQWAYAVIANQICKYNDLREVKFKHLTYKSDLQKIKKTHCDFYFVLGWQVCKKMPFLDKKRTLVGVHSHQSFDNKKTTPEKDVYPSQKVLDYLADFKAINVVSKRLFAIFKQSGLDVVYTRNGVDIDVFRPCLRSKNCFSVGCAASRKNDWNKSFFTLIEPACCVANVKSVSAMIDINRHKHNKMPVFYNRLDCYVCASRSEGMSLTVLEAASCGCVILSSKVGDNVLLIQNYKNGIFIDRNITDIAEKLIYLKDNSDRRIQMSKNMRETVEKHWSWKENIKDWLDFIRRSIKKCKN